MGDPRKLRKKYSTPMHPWDAEKIKLEKGLIKEYGLRNKSEIWKMGSVLKKYKDLAKKLIAVKTSQGEKEKKQMMDKLQKWGLIQVGAELDDVLSLDVKDIIERRLQSLVFRNGLARNMKQARQFITHRHVMVGDRKITFPSYIVSQEEEGQIKFDSGSSLSNEDHPERIDLSEGVREEAEKIKVKKSKEKEEEGEEPKPKESESSEETKPKEVPEEPKSEGKEK